MITTPTLIDNSGRRIRKLRVSIIDACNFRCHYCMPEDSTFMPHSNLLTPGEIYQIASHLVAHGVDQIRVTGGEPTVRREFREIVESLATLPLAKFGLTTNGLLLKKHLPIMKEINCKHINISCDSLNREKFNRITRRLSFDHVMDSILTAKAMDFPVKLNVVLMAGVNDDEILDFVKFSENHQIPVRFLELMRIGQVCQSQNNQFMPANDALEQIKTRYSLAPITSDSDSTSFNYVTERGGQIGFIASESMPFCGTCSRWRLSADGFLRACLMSETGIKIKGRDPSEYPDIFNKMLPLKPTGRILEIHQNMNQIGG